MWGSYHGRRVLNKLWFLLFMPGLPIAGLFFWMWRWRTLRDQTSKRPFNQMPRPPGWSLRFRIEDLMSEFVINKHDDLPHRGHRLGILRMVRIRLTSTIG